jgi:hypothetical protein
MPATVFGSSAPAERYGNAQDKRGAQRASVGYAIDLIG